MNVGSLFSGVGGFDLAFDRAGCSIQWQVEINKSCQTILERNWPGVERHRDVQQVNGLRDVDAVVGGFPCQDLSRAGGRAGLGGERSRLWWEFHRVIKELTPRWVLIENVPGLLTSGEPVGSDMGTILSALGDLGYGFAYRVLDARWFGIAQRRRRVFIVGCLGDTTRPAQVLFEPEISIRDTPSSTEPPPSSRGSVAVYRKSRRAQNVTDYETWVEESASNTLNTYENTDVRATNLVVQNRNVRRLTPLEYERLQGFPDNWTTGFGDSTRCRMMGNAVCVPVVEWIAKRMMIHA